MTAADDLKPLDDAIREIRRLHEAAEQAAGRIHAEVSRLGEREAGELIADLAEAVVERTELIRADTEQLSMLLQRARAAVAAHAGAEAWAPPPAEVEPAFADLEPGFADLELGFADVELPPVDVEPASVEEPPARPWTWRFWRRGRTTKDVVPEAAVPPPPRLPRLDFSAPGVPGVERRDYSSPGTSPVPEGVRLIATQMAVAGATRVEVERRLRRQFGIVDASPALDEIFGYGSLTSAESR